VSCAIQAALFDVLMYFNVSMAQWLSFIALKADRENGSPLLYIVAIQEGCKWLFAV